MIEIEQKLRDLGLNDEQITAVVDVMERERENSPDGRVAEIRRAAEFICLVFLRVGRDSVAGCALRRALGFSNEASFARAAKDFGVTKQHLHAVQHELEEQLGEKLTFVTRQARKPVPVRHDDEDGDGVTQP